MVYVSTSGVKFKHIADSIRCIADYGHTHIELSGGTDYYEGIEKDLVELRESYGLTYLLHNYFPPPKADFVVNLSCLDDAVYKATLEHLSATIQLSARLGVYDFGFHAGFLLNLSTKDLGKKVAVYEMYPREESRERFWRGYAELQHIAREEGVTLYIENNVLSQENAATYVNEDPFFLLTSEGYSSFKEGFVESYNLLLDFAHLKVSANSKGKDFHEELEMLAPRSSYWHLSENDGKRDLNWHLTENSEVLLAFKKLVAHGIKPKYITLEIYERPEEWMKSVRLIEDVLEGEK